MGFNSEAVVVRDVLGPTNTNWDRQYEYEVAWPTFIASIEAHAWDGRAVYPPGTVLEPENEPEKIVHSTQKDDGTGI